MSELKTSMKPLGYMSLGLAAVFCLTSMATAVDAQTRASSGNKAQESYAYPRPSFPRFVANPTDEQLMDVARQVVWQTSGRAPFGKMQSGETVHVFLDSTQSQKVWKTIKDAWAERGVTAVPVYYWEILGISEKEYRAAIAGSLNHGKDGWKEMSTVAYNRFFPEEVLRTFTVMDPALNIGGSPVGAPSDAQEAPPFIDYMVKHPEMTKFYGFPGGYTIVNEMIRNYLGTEEAKKFMGNWIYMSGTDLASQQGAFPSDVWKMIDEQILRPIPHVAEGTMQDAQGTDLHWVMTPEQSAKWERGSGLSSYYSPGHLNVYPQSILATWKKGTVVATGNHTGFHPAMTVRIGEFGQVISVEGGGRNGDLFRHLVSHPDLKPPLRFPNAPTAGYWFLSQDGMGTNPKVVRNYPDLIEGRPGSTNLSERNRAGVQHFSFSNPFGLSRRFAEAAGMQEEDVAVFADKDVPLAHTAHMHTYFNTVKWKLRDTGEWIPVMEKGRLSAFDNPEIRALASKYGDPDMIFSYDWIPDIPGINAPGSRSAFEADPWSYLANSWEKMKNGTYEYLIDDYDWSDE